MFLRSLNRRYLNTVALTKVGVTVVMGSLVALFLPPFVLAQAPPPFVNFSGTNCQGSGLAGQGDLIQVINSVVGVIFVLVGFAATAMMVYGGIKYLLAGGDKEAAAGARNTLTYAIIGFILAASIWAVFGLIGSFLGVNLRTFNLCF